jgi:selenocysteine lyase/cysteine desulfurase
VKSPLSNPTGSTAAATGGKAGLTAGMVTTERARTAGATVTHHFNSAGAALPTDQVVQTVIDHLRLEQLHGGYEAAAMVTDRVDAVYTAAARLIRVDRDEIALFDSATTGLRTAIDAIRLTASDRMLVSRSTYVSHALHLLSLARDRGLTVEILPSAEDGTVDVEQLERSLSVGAPPIVCVAHVPTSSGLVEPVQRIGHLTRTHGATFVLDATQSVGQLAVDVRHIGCDVLVTTGRKFLRAPRGTGFAYFRREFASTLAPSAPDVRGALWTSEHTWELRPSARRFESWEASIATRLGLGVALDQTLELGINTIEHYLVELGRQLRGRLAEIPGVVVRDPAAARSGIVTFTVDGMTAEAVSSALAARRICTVAVPAGHARWDLGNRGIDAVVRASVHVYNDEPDLDALIAAVADIVAGQRQQGPL